MKAKSVEAISDILILRTDATRESGIGHVMRCLALAQAWKKEGGRATFVGAFDSDHVRNRIGHEGFDLMGIRDDRFPDPSAEIHQLLDLVGHRDRIANHSKPKTAAKGQPHDTWVVLDGYHFGSEYQKALQDAGFRVLIIDDAPHLSVYYADILLNQNIHAAALNYPSYPGIVFLFGPKYVLLRREFIEKYNDDKHIPLRAKKILITCGGVDSKNITEKAIDALTQSCNSDLTVRIVVGPGNPHAKSLSKKLKSVPFEYELLQDVDDMSSLMAEAEISITASGSTCWETAFMRVPSITMILSDNQEKVAVQIDRAGISLCLGWWDKVEAAALSMSLSELINSQVLRREQVNNAKNLIDGRGAHRACAAMKLLSGKIEEGEFILRNAKREDREQLFMLANDPDVRKYSFHPTQINFKDHCRWFERKLDMPEKTTMHVLEYEEIIVGQVRYDRIDGRKAEVDVSVHPAFRKRGLGKVILAGTIESALIQLNVNSIRGVVFESNGASRTCFVKAGFKEKKRATIKNHPCFVYEYGTATNYERLH